MHVPDKWQLEDRARIVEFMQANSFAVVVSPSLQASHIPLILDQSCNKLMGHVARANPHWREISEQKALVIFGGEHSYISPTWYTNKPAVPTWNYAAIHVKGKVTLMNDEDTFEALNKMLSFYEAELLNARDVVTAEFQEKLLKGIVGFSIDIEDVDAKIKLGQHRSKEDQLGVVNGLEKSRSHGAKALLSYMHQLNIGLGN